MEKLYIVMPAYNEEANIESVVKDWYPILDLAGRGSKLVIADSGSQDNTHKILKKMQKEYKNLVVVSDSGKQHGPKLIYLYKYAIKNKADYIFQTDSDGQTNPKEFKKFWKNREKYDAILGNRVVRGDGKQRKFVENTLCKILKHYFKVSIPDANAPFRLMKSSVVNKYIDRFDDEYNLPNVMLSTFFVYYKDKVKFETITFKPRQGGKNSINIKKIVKIGFAALKDFKNFQKGL